MPPTSALQSQYPLSPRKFWKKMIQKVVALVIVSVLLSFVCFMAFLAFVTDQHFNVNQAEPHSYLLRSLFSFVVCVIYGIYVSAYIKRYYYDATDSYVTIKKGVFAPAEIHVQYAKIQDVYVDQDILDKIMGLYDVHLASATIASGIEAHVDGVDKNGADGLKNLLLQKLQGGGSVSPMSSIPAIRCVSNI